MQRREFLAGLAAIGASALVPDVLKGAQSRPAAPAFRIDVHNHGNSPGFIAAIKAHNTGQTALMSFVTCPWSFVEGSLQLTSTTNDK